MFLGSWLKDQYGGGRGALGARLWLPFLILGNPRGCFCYEIPQIQLG